MRVCYAHETHSSRSKSIAFNFFKRQNLLAGIVCLCILIKGTLMYVKSNSFKLVI